MSITVPTCDDVSPASQALFDNLKKGLDMVPNLDATLAHSEHAVGNDPAFQNAKGSRTTGHLVDVIVAIGDKTVTNDLHATTQVPVDFPPAPALSA